MYKSSGRGREEFSRCGKETKDEKERRRSCLNGKRRKANVQCGTEMEETKREAMEQGRWRRKAEIQAAIERMRGRMEGRVSKNEDRRDGSEWQGSTKK